MLTSGTEAPESKIDSALRQKAETALDYLISLADDQEAQSAYRQGIETEHPELFSAMLALAEERNAASHARSEAHHREFERLATEQQAVRGLMDQALRNVTQRGVARLEEIKKAFGE
jgi:hypothetical protein